MTQWCHCLQTEKQNMLVRNVWNVYMQLAFLVATLVLPMAVSGQSGGFLWQDGYENDSWQQNWGLEWDNANNQQIIGSDVLSGSKAALVTYPAGTYSSGGSVQYKMRFNRTIPEIAVSDSMYVRYYVKFGANIDFIKGGKLPGLIGGDANTGGRKPTGFDGFSARIMWRADGRIIQYVYHPDQPGKYGDSLQWDEGGEPRFFTPGRWHCVETYLQMNTVVDGKGEFNGVVRSWLDGELALNRTDIRFRYTDELQIDGLYFSTFFGGGDASWAPVKDETAMFDDFVINDQRIGCGGGVCVPDASAGDSHRLQ